MAQRVPYSLFPNSQHPGSQWHSDNYTDFSWQSFDNPNGTGTVTQTSFGNFFWQSQWHSDCYTDFFWQFLLTIPMAQRLLHRLLLSIFFDNPNGTATVAQTSFSNFVWQSQWHSDCYTDFFCQSSFDNPNGTATVTQTSFGNFFWAQILQWHNDCVAQTSFATNFLATETRFNGTEDLLQETSCGNSVGAADSPIKCVAFQVQKPSDSKHGDRGRLRFDEDSLVQGNVVQSYSSQTYDFFLAHYESTKSPNNPVQQLTKY